jgi:Protein  of unknown function (DUF3018)
MALARKSKHSKPSPVNQRVRQFRERMRRLGMKEIRFWVPDVNSPRFKAEARRQSRLADKSVDEAEVMAFIESHSGWLWDGDGK